MPSPLPAPHDLGTMIHMKILFTLLLSLGLFCIISANPAYAQIDFGFDDDQTEEEEGPKVVNPYDKKYKPDLKAEKSEGTSLVPNFIYNARFIRKPNADPDDLNLRISSPSSAFGCLTIENPRIKPTQIGSTLRLKLTDGYISVDNETIRYFHYECKSIPGQSEMHLTLSKEQLIKDGINKLVLVSEEIGPLNDMLLDFKDNSVTITSKMHDLTQFGVPITGQTDIFTYWVYPENTMALFSSSLDLRDKEIRRNVKALARRKGLTPLDEVITGFKPHHDNADKLYVVDIPGRFKDKVAKPGDVFSLGKIETKTPYFGADGAYDKATLKTILAKKPGPAE